MTYNEGALFDYIIYFGRILEADLLEDAYHETPSLIVIYSERLFSRL